MSADFSLLIELTQVIYDLFVHLVTLLVFNRFMLDCDFFQGMDLHHIFVD
jgi:hypothetical protein